MRSTHNRRLDRLKAVQNDHKLLKKHSAQLEEDLYGYVSKHSAQLEEDLYGYVSKHGVFRTGWL